MPSPFLCWLHLCPAPVHFPRNLVSLSWVRNVGPGCNGWYFFCLGAPKSRIGGSGPAAPSRLHSTLLQCFGNSSAHLRMDLFSLLAFQPGLPHVSRIYSHVLHCLSCAGRAVTNFGSAPKRRIGGSGTPAGPEALYLMRSMQWCGKVCLAFYIALSGLLTATLWRMLFRVLPGSFSPLGRLLQMPWVHSPPIAKAWCFSCPTTPVLRWEAFSHCEGKSRKVCRQGRVPWAMRWLFGFASLPMQIWAAPAGLPEAVAHVHGLTASMPDTWPSAAAEDRSATSSGTAVRDLDHQPSITRYSDASAPWPRRHAQPQHPVSSLDPAKVFRITFPRTASDNHPTTEWIGIILYAPYYQAEQWGVRMPDFPTVPAMQAEAEMILSEAFDGSMDMLTPVSPQRYGESLQYICFPSILNSSGSSGVAVIIDASAVGGHYFPTILARVLTFEQLAAFIRPLLSYGIDDFHFLVGTATTEYGPGSTFILSHGDVVTVAGPLTHAPNPITPADVLSEGNPLSPMHQIWMNITTPGLCLLHQGERFLLLQYRQDGRSIEEAVSFMLDLEPDQWIAKAAHHFRNLDVQGTACDRLIGCFRLPPVRADNPFTRNRRDIWVFFDFRPLGHRPQAVLSHVFRIHVPSVLAHFAIHVPEDFDLCIEGGVLAGDEVLLGLNNTLIFRATPLCTSPDDENDANPSPHPALRSDDEPPDETRPEAGTSGSRHVSRGARSRSRSPHTADDASGPTASLSPLSKFASKLSSAFGPLPNPQYVCNDKACLTAADLLRAAAFCHTIPGPLYERLWSIFEMPIAAKLGSFSDATCRYLAFMTAKGHAGDATRSSPNRIAIAADQGLQVEEVEQVTPPHAETEHFTVFAPEADEAEAERQPFVDVRCLIYAPEYIPDLLLAPLAIPCSVEQATAVFSDVRDESQAESFPNIFPATPQPVRQCAIYVAVPAWVEHRLVILYNLQAINDCLFSVAVPHRLNKASLLTIAAIRDHATHAVFVHGLLQPLQDDLWIELHHGCTVTIVAAGRGPPPSWQLHEMLQDTDGWDHRAHVPGPGGCPGDHFWILTDGMPCRFDVLPGRRGSVKQDIIAALRYETWRATVKPTTPRIIDHMWQGFVSSGVLVATEALSCIPYPPARVRENRKILVLDCRAALLGFQWQFFTGEWVLLQHLADRFADHCPLRCLVRHRTHR